MKIAQEISVSPYVQSKPPREICLAINYALEEDAAELQL